MAVVYDFLECIGGAEGFAVDLASRLQQKLFVGYSAPKIREHFSNPYVEICEIGSRVTIPILKSEYYYWAFKLRTHSIPKDSVHVVSGQVALHCVSGLRCGFKIYYCHTPPRFSSDLKDYYLKQVPFFFRPLLSVYGAITNRRFKRSIGKFDLILCNSENVRQRLQHYYGIEARVLYPPVPSKAFYFREPEGFYLSTARLEPFKRVEEIISAFREMPDKKLIVMSTGSLELKLRAENASYENIFFTGSISNTEHCDLLSRCIATVYVPINEDFGMSPVESLCSGKPVIGVKDGGLLETVSHGTTGYLCDPSILLEELKTAVGLIDGATARGMREDCETAGQKFHHSYFYASFSSLIPENRRLGVLTDEMLDE